MMTSEPEIASTPPSGSPQIAVGKWTLYKQHRMYRSFTFSSQPATFRFVAELSALTAQHPHKVALRARGGRVFFEVEVAADGATADQLDFIQAIDALQQSAA